MYVSGCVGMDKDTMKLVEGGVVPETIQVLKNLVAVLEAAGSSAEKVVKATIFVENMADFALVNEEYKKGKNIFRNVCTCTLNDFFVRNNELLGLSHRITKEINISSPAYQLI